MAQETKKPTPAKPKTKTQEKKPATGKVTVKKVAKTPPKPKTADTVIKTPQTQNAPTTGHEWDGIQEYNNPLPRWWLWVWLISILFSIGYVIYYPAIPLLNGFTQGTAGWSQYEQLNDMMQYAETHKAPFEEKISRMSIHALQNDEDMRAYALASGKATFALHCSQCHGSGAAGAKGYPSLLDDEWIWGGTMDDILYTITHGIRSQHDSENTRDMGPMTAYGDLEILDDTQIKDVVNTIKRWSKPYLPETESVERGAEIFAENCSSCHGDNGAGMQDLGAPALNNAIWLYGGDTKTMVETIAHGRAGQMPAFGVKLSDNDIKKLAVFVHSLSGGEK